MKIALNWLKKYIKIEHSAEDLAQLLTDTGLEVEGIEELESVKGGLRGVVIGEVLTCQPHENADKLKVTSVDVGLDEPLQIVCGAPNVAAGQKVVVATPNTTLYPTPDKPFEIKKSKIRGEVSMGMICAEDELGLGQSHDAILVLETNLANGTPAAEYFNISSDFVFEIGLTPNRADATGHIGAARDIKAVTKNEINWPSVNNFAVDNTNRTINVVVEDHEACPRYSGLTISNLSVETSPEWLQNALKSIGLEPINNIVDVTNFVLHELGQPLHAFDADRITGDKVIIGQLPENTAFTTLDEKDRKLQATDLMICDGQKQPMCMAGVFGGIELRCNLKNNKYLFRISLFFC